MNGTSFCSHLVFYLPFPSTAADYPSGTSSAFMDLALPEHGEEWQPVSYPSIGLRAHRQPEGRALAIGAGNDLRPGNRPR
ncbi:hypothetical protein C8R43DRAFT_1018869 [Mycena crocata]|nr:hypothetical protein C8R43DRAFT_1018869 [Mycena crocata]